MEELVVAVFLILFTLEFLVEFVLNELNLRYVRARWAERKIPDFFQGKISSEDYDKSVDYTLAKGEFQRWAEVYSRLVALVVLFSGMLPYLDMLSGQWAAKFFPMSEAQGIIFCLGVALVFSLASLPTDIYSTFGLEARFGFNKMTPGLYIADKLKALLIGLVIGVPFLFVLFWLMETMGRFWWIWAFLFISGFQLLMIVVYPTLIAPLFNKFEPLKEGELRDRILRLADQIGFKTSGIYSMDGSKRSGHSNAYFTGIGKAKRIVLFDTLIEQMTIQQGLAVLAHEMGHYKMKHIRCMLVVQTVFLFSLLAGPLTFYLSPLINVLSRKHEYEADCFAAKTLREGKSMEEALVNLTIKNLSNLTPHPWYSAYHYSHPTPAERIAAIRQCAA